MEKSRKVLREQVRNQYIEKIFQFLAEVEDVGMTASNEFNFPIVDAEGNEDFIVVKVAIPTGSRDGDPYDGYGARNDYQLHLKEKAEKEEKAKAAKAKKIARDQEKRDKAQK